MLIYFLADLYKQNQSLLHVPRMLYLVMFLPDQQCSLSTSTDTAVGHRNWSKRMSAALSR